MREDLYFAFRDKAYSEGKTASAVITELMRDYVGLPQDNEEGKPKEESPQKEEAELSEDSDSTKSVTPSGEDRVVKYDFSKGDPVDHVVNNDIKNYDFFSGVNSL